MYGLVYGTFGLIALLLGGILGGLYAAKRGLRASYWPMALALALPCAVYLLMAILRPESVWVIGGFVVLDQFGYGFGACRHFECDFSGRRRGAPARPRRGCPCA